MTVTTPVPPSAVMSPVRKPSSKLESTQESKTKPLSTFKMHIQSKPPAVPAQVSKDRVNDWLAPQGKTTQTLVLKEREASVFNASTPMKYIRGDDGKVYIVVAKEIDNPHILKSISIQDKQEAPRVSIEEILLLKAKEQQKSFNTREVLGFRIYEAYNIKASFLRR